ncbi:hypothetical protein AU255_00715 [Methyloprofundus sedimenti]|uniref:Carrier domain-containing protein n=2 Tax=Methyloprofundus sedimenti TaxID=1420851 RepID=A0A1V8M4Y3_9GAMM|nr:hypothetical protein AU255_00715 [Methyloprofundus sedimenti]
MSYSNIVELICSKANERANKTAYIFLQDGENESARINFAELDQRARTIAARLQNLGMTGERALLLYPPGFDYIEGFLGCLYAGVIAVPAYPPSRRHKSRLFAVINDALPAIILTTNDLKERLIIDFTDSDMNQQDFNWLATDNLEKEIAESWVQPELNSDSLAFLQYTSGTTGDPKGVIVSHGNLMDNQLSIQQGFKHTEDSVVVGWLPLYHDMGLIGNLLQPLYLGATAILMPPMVFLEKPIRWLRAIANYKAETSGGPNFAYDLCYQKITPEQMQGLDLRTWTLAFNGSEPVHDKTMERFAEKFSDCGFELGSFYPCYGLAEATLFVSGKKLQIENGNICSADLSMLSEQKQAQFNSVSCGSISTDPQLYIVNPETAKLCQDGDVGEIWLTGANITQGYWNRPELSKQMFQAEILEQSQKGERFLALDNKSYLRTGDLGFVSDEQLYISGRIKDLIIIRGRNFYPQDIERTLTENISDLMSDGCVAFSITGEDQQEKLIVAAELTRSAMRQKNYAASIANIRQALTEICEVTPEELVLLRLGTVPKTSSGKNRRQAFKKMYEQNNLTELFRSGASQHSSNRSKKMDDIVSSTATLTPEFKMLKQALAVIPPDQRSALISQFLKNKIALMMKQDESEITPELSLPAFGLDSLKVVELKHIVDQLLDKDIPLSLFLSDSSLTEIAQQLSEIIQRSAEHQAEDKSLEKGHAEPEKISEAISLNKKDTSTLSSTQLSMWTMQQLEPDSIIYNLHLALQIQGEVKQEALHQAFQFLLQRHTQLRTVYRISDDETVKQHVLEVTEVEEIFSLIDASSWSKDQLQDDMTHKAREAFDLSSGPLIRTHFYEQNTDDKQNTLLICAHHIAIDLWSVLILIDELKIIYADLIAGQISQLPALKSNYNDFVSWQQGYMQSPNSQKDWDYWQKQLSGELPLLALPTDYQRPTVSDYHGASLAFQLNKEDTEQLKNLAKKQGVTLFALLLTAYKVLLHRYTHQKDVIVGVPTSGRSQSSFALVVGNFVNPLPLRSYPSGDKSFTDYLAEVNESLQMALKHQDYPFSQIVDQLQPERIADHWPIYQTMFVLQQAQMGIDSDLASLTLGENSVESAWGDWNVRAFKMEQRVENFDLMVMATEDAEGLVFSFQNRDSIFSSISIEQLKSNFATLLKGIVANPNERLLDLPLLACSERNKVLNEWNAKTVSYPECCLHELFEKQALKTPQSTAVCCSGMSINYQELNERANYVASYLSRIGISREDRVGLCLERSIEVIICIFAVLKSGGTYVPVDPGSPSERITDIIKDCDAKILITQDHLLEQIKIENISVLYLDRDWGKITEQELISQPSYVQPDNAAYIIYTSGSTGKPKGVVVSHANAVASTFARFNFYPEVVEGFLLLSSYTFDSSIAGIFWTLSQGGKLCIPSEESYQDPIALAEVIQQEQLSHLLCLPALYSLLLEGVKSSQLAGLKTVIVAGENCPSTLPRLHFKSLKNTRFYNEYGPTEGTVWCSAYEFKKSDVNVGMSAFIGNPISNTKIYLLDEYLNPVAIGVTGELYIAGRGVCRCYYKQPNLTAERFIPNHFESGVGERLYRTGDLASWTNDGNLKFLGRVDHQVKIRGFRVELDEIESRLLEYGEVEEVMVIASESNAGTKHLIAYFVPVQSDLEELVSIDRLTLYLKSCLPVYMIPSFFVKLEQLPKTANGKINRKALPVPEWNELSIQQYTAPGTAIERQLSEIWAKVLRLEKAGINDNFFSLGGDSILAIQIAIQAHKAGLSFTARELFQNQTIAELASVIQSVEQDIEDTKLAEKVICEQFPLSRLELKELSELPYDLDELEDIYPLTPMQEGMLFHTLMEPGSGVYLMQDRFELKGAIDVAVFKKAWDLVIRRNPILRSSFVWNVTSTPHQIVHKQLNVAFEFFDWRDLSKQDQKSQLENILQNELKDGFDLLHPPLLRLRLILISEEQYQFVRSHHHILLDAWCTSLILTEFKSNYDKLIANDLIEQIAATPFSDYVVWLQKQDVIAEEKFWRNYLDGFTVSTPLVVDRLTNGNELMDVADVSIQLPETSTRCLNDVAQKLRLTPNTFVQGAWALLLNRYSNLNEVLFGITVTGRPVELTNVEGILGLFINGLPLRVSIDRRKSVRVFLHELQNQNLEMRQFEHSSLTSIQEWSGLSRDQDLFQHLLTFENAPVDPKLRKRTGSFWFEDISVRTHTNYPITVMVIPDTKIHLQITYQTARFEVDVIERMLLHFKNLLEDMVAYPDKQLCNVDMLSVEESNNSLIYWNQTQYSYSEPCDIVASFEAQVVQTPNQMAVAYKGQKLSYLELNHRVNCVAHALLAEGVVPEMLIALFSDRGVEYMVMMLSVFKVGAAYMPLDPAHPDARIEQVVKESGANKIFTNAAYAERAQTLVDSLADESATNSSQMGASTDVITPFESLHQPDVLRLEVLEICENKANPPRQHFPTNLAFVIFTSGSTGLPKGAMVEHQGMFNNLITKVPTLGLTEHDAIAQTAGQCFDISVWQHLTALVCGARVEIIPDEIVKEPNLLLSHLAENSVTILEAVPSMIQALLDMADESNKLPELRWLIACGEAFPPELCRRWMDQYPHVKVLNAYGPAECSDDVSYYQVPEQPGETDAIVPIGQPVHNTKLYLLNHWQKLAPIGVPGEICVSGIQVGRGYLGRADLTAEKFIPDAFDEAGQRLYRTGDLGRYREDGTIEFLGRIDHQVKIRGVRIEPGEIEAHILTFPQVVQVFVMVRENGATGKRLVAYVVCDKSEITRDVELIAGLRNHLSTLLPIVMMPSAFVLLDTLPVSSNGKIDRKVLPEPDMAEQSDTTYLAPRNPAEETLVDIWREVLDIEQIGVTDNFFELGGHSLLAVQVLSRIRKDFGIEVPLRQLFEASTIEVLALLVEEFLIEHLNSLSEEEAEALLNDHEQDE